jgi:ADP-heptose:LPS heptosyltransferase
VYVLEHRRLHTWPELLWRLRAQKYDLILCLNGDSFKAALFTRLAGAKASFACTGARPRYAGYFDQALATVPDKHITRSGLDFFSKLGIPPAGEGMELVIPEAVRGKAVARYPKSKKKRLAVFIGNARKVHSRWPAEKFAQVVQDLLATHENLEIFLLCGPDELPLLTQFTPHKRLETVTEKLMDCAAFLTTCDALLTSSSGPWHVAAAVGTPTLGIISRYNYEIWRPLEGEHRFVLEEGKDVRGIEVAPVREMVEESLALN